MPNNNKIILGLLALAIVFGGASTSQAKTENAPVTSENKVPIVIEANQLTFSEETGDILAQGKVVITNQGQKIEAELINGNTKLSEIWINDQAVFSEQDATIHGQHTQYNYKLKTGNMEQANGKIGHKFVSGQNISMFPDKYLIQQGTTTNCPAKIPDYHVSADKIEIWPGDKLIAYNAKFWIKNTVIFSLPKYQQSLQPGQQDSAFPRIGYNSEDGAYIKQHLEYPIVNNFAAFANLDYYSKSGFKPSYGLMDREKNYTLSLSHGYFQDDDDNWIKKEPEFKLAYKSQRIGKLPVSYTFTAVYGKWTDKYKTSWHQDYNLYFAHDPIKLNNTMNLYLGTGIEHVRESYNNSAENIIKYDATIDKKWSDRLYTWVGYHHTENNNTLFEYNKTDINRELASGFSYKIDRMNSIGVSQSYDLDTKRLEDVDYTWYRNLHCWQATITYRAKREEFKFDITTTRW